jgi:hypothetical protein
MSIFNPGNEAAKELLKPENLEKLKAAGLEMLQQFAKQNVIHADISFGDAGTKIDLSFSPKGTNKP